jgi:hypothetical protein
MFPVDNKIATLLAYFLAGTRDVYRGGIIMSSV